MARVAAVDKRTTSDLNWHKGAERSCECRQAGGDPGEREVAYAETGQTGVAEIAPSWLKSWAISPNRPQLVETGAEPRP